MVFETKQSQGKPEPGRPNYSNPDNLGCISEIDPLECPVVVYIDCLRISVLDDSKEAMVNHRVDT